MLNSSAPQKRTRSGSYLPVDVPIRRVRNGNVEPACEEGRSGLKTRLNADVGMSAAKDRW